ncbi:MAG: class I SAM-dependent methyltransferase [Acidobacteriota bacterium]|nr:MAG: class I SAM-dependent methyltransferase [Acidobacteriota bacterium]
MTPRSLEQLYTALEERHLEKMTFQEVRRALQALSSLYVQRRGRLQRGHGLDTAGKRAAFALFYGTLHFIQVREVVRELGLDQLPISTIFDLGCGTGTSGAAWARECTSAVSLKGFDQNAWAIAEARWVYQGLGLKGEAVQGDLLRAKWGQPGTGVLLAFSANELEPGPRQRLLTRLIRAAGNGATLLIIEPISRKVTPWLEEWSEKLSPSGAQLRDWRFSVELPDRFALLDKAAGLDHRSEITCRTLCCRPD